MMICNSLVDKVAHFLSVVIEVQSSEFWQSILKKFYSAFLRSLENDSVYNCFVSFAVREQLEPKPE